MTLKVWLTQDGEPLPIQDSNRLFRTGLIAKELVEQNVEVDWFASRFSHSNKKNVDILNDIIEIKNNYRIHLLPGVEYKKNFSPFRIIHQQSIARNFSNIANQLKLPDLIIASYPSPELAFAAMKFAKNNNIKLIIDIRDPWPESFKNYYPKAINFILNPLVNHYKKLLSQTVKNSNAIFAVNQNFLDFGLKYASRQLNDFDSVFYLGYDEPLNISKPPTHKIFNQNQPLNCVFAGIFGKTYNLKLIIDAARILAREGNTSVKFTIIGDGDLYDKWKFEASGLNNIEFTGWLGAKEIKSKLNQSHIGLTPISKAMSDVWLGNKFFEYMSHSLALVNTATSEAQDIISKHEVGITLNNSNSAKELSQVLENYLNNPNLLHRHMKNSGAAFKSYYTAEKTYKSYVRKIFEISQIVPIKEPVNV